jgi:hypothetical protein
LIVEPSIVISRGEGEIKIVSDSTGYVDLCSRRKYKVPFSYIWNASNAARTAPIAKSISESIPTVPVETAALFTIMPSKATTFPMALTRYENPTEATETIASNATNLPRGIQKLKKSCVLRPFISALYLCVSR